MKSGRLYILLFTLLMGGILTASDAVAFWGFGEEKGKSGLDFDKGYDLNTVVTVKGKVLSVDFEGGGPITITLRGGKEIINAVAAPRWYWVDRGISIKPDDELMVSGAKAQGKDGKMYIISRDIRNLTSGQEVTLRDDNGRPAWKGGSHGERGGGGGMQRRFGGGRRGR